MIFGFRRNCVVIIAPFLENVKPPGAFNRNFMVYEICPIKARSVSRLLPGIIY
jgi:hypothetical protein